MKILVVGGEFSNKGAELMIHSVYNQVSAYFPNAQLFISPTLAKNKTISDAGYMPLNFPLFHFGYNAPWQFNLSLKLPYLVKSYLKGKKNIQFSGSTKLSDIDLILDISGYAFADKWGMIPMKNLNSLMSYAKKRNIKYVFLPQAFGPFSEEQIPVMKDCISMAEMVIARDDTSYSNLKQLESNTQKIKCFPDITLSFSKTKEDSSSEHSYCCIVPNVRMLDKTENGWSEKYESILTNVVKNILSNSDLNVKIVNHSVHDDLDLVNKLSNVFIENKRVSPVLEANPMKLKKILASSNFNIASRFHAVASSLSNSVPCIMTSWSHKYQELAKEYDVKEFCVITPDENYLISLLSRLITVESNQKIRAALTLKNKEISLQNKKMWSEIKSVIE